MSGLITAYLLRDRRPVILEHAPRFGGNSKGENWRGVNYSLAAAYFIRPEADSPIGQLATELGLDKEWRLSGNDSYELEGGIHTGFWHKGSSRSAGHEKLRRYFSALQDGSLGPYPDIPVGANDDAVAVAKLDTLSFYDHVKAVAGGNLDSVTEKVIEYYCWSSFGASAKEISAAAGVNFYAAEFGELAVLPGGNARCAEIILDRLYRELPQNHLRPSSTVIRVAKAERGAVVTYLDAENRARSILADAVVLACPKFVASRILGDAIESERAAAIKRLRYRAAAVGNILVDAPIKETALYDLFLVGDKKPSDDKAKVTDAICATFSSPHPDRSVLTLYHSFPFDGGRELLFPQEGYSKLHGVFSEVGERVLHLLNVPANKITGVRIARWGHPFPVAERGLIADGVPYELRKPFQDRVFFVHQDNWALPAFETAATEALITAPLIREVLKQS